MKKLLLVLILLLGLFVRFINFYESVYFGYDEARDAYLSTEIYTKGDLKLIGPQASSFAGIHHGPIYYYLIGPLYLISEGNPYFVSAVFRIFNLFGAVLLYLTIFLFFGKTTALISVFLYAISYEQYIYSIFSGNPSISNISWILMFFGCALIVKTKRIKTGFLFVLLGGTTIPQFDLIGSYSLAIMSVLLFKLRKNISVIKTAQKTILTIVGLSPLYTYLLSEIKYDFLGLKTGLSLISSDISIANQQQPIWKIFLINLAGLVENNIFDFNQPIYSSILLLFMIILILFLYSKKKPDVKFLLIWILSIFFLIFARGFMPFYSYAGIGIGLISGFSFLLTKILKSSHLIFYTLIIIIFLSNISKIIDQSKNSLIVEIKAQPGMKLSDEIKIIDRTYELAQGNGFTIRTTTMPYKIQTVWSYLYRKYGNTYGYLPFNETGNVEGFPGKLPVPTEGESCIRFLIREPIRGIPQNLIDYDLGEENYFSYIVFEEKIGDFLLQYRKSKSQNCHYERS